MANSNEIIVIANFNSTLGSQTQIVLSQAEKDKLEKKGLPISQSLNWTAYANRFKETKFFEYDSKTKAHTAIDGTTIPTGTPVAVTLEVSSRRNQDGTRSKNVAACRQVLVEANTYEKQQSESEKEASLSQQAIKALMKARAAS